MLRNARDTGLCVRIVGRVGTNDEKDQALASAFMFRYDKQEPITVAGDVFANVIDSIDSLDAT